MNWLNRLTTKKALSIIILFGIVVLGNSLFNNFVGDDYPQIINNPTTQNIHNLFNFFSGSVFYSGGAEKLGGNYYRPLMNTSFSLIYTFFGSNYFMFHLFQLTIIIANAYLLFLVFSYFFKKHVSLILAIIFLIHPFNSETTFYIAAMQDVLFFFFGILAFRITQKYDSPKHIAYITLLIFASLLSKETGLLFIPLILVFTFFYKRKIFGTVIASLALVSATYFLLRTHAIGVVAATTPNAPIERLDLIHRMISMPSIFLFYIKTFLLPINFAVSYQWVVSKIDFQNFGLPLAIDTLFLLGVLSGVILLFKRKNKLLVPYIMFAMIFLSGVMFHLQFYPLDQSVADRWFYFPSVGLLGILGVFISLLIKKYQTKKLFYFAILIIFILSLRTIIRSFDWRNDIMLSTHDIKVSPQAWGLENELSFAYAKKGDYERAKLHALKSIKIFSYIINYTSLGASYTSLGQYENAKNAYIEGLKYGDNFQAYENLAGISMIKNDNKDGAEFIKSKALPRYPRNGIIWMDLAIIKYRNGDIEEAKLDITQAEIHNPDPIINFVYNAIMNNKKLTLTINKGRVTYHYE